MAWKIIINKHAYQLVMPFELIDSHTEDLDSAKVSIAHITGKLDLTTDMPVILTNNDNNIDDWENNLFYRVMLIDSWKEQQINIFEDIYNYELDLYSLTKALEFFTGDTTVAITQSRDLSQTNYTLADALNAVNYKVSQNYLIKVADNGSWKYESRFAFDQDMMSELAQVRSPEFRFNSLTLREMYSRILSTKNYIPKLNSDFTITYLDMTLNSVKEMDLTNAELSSSVRSLSSNVSADGFTQNLQNVITETDSNIDNLTTTFEYVGFRSYTQPAISSALKNLKLFTNFPIYKINKFYIVGYWKMRSFGQSTTELDFVRWNSLDISGLVLYSKERAALPYKPTSEELSDFDTNYIVSSDMVRLEDMINFMKGYQCFTFEYQQGGKEITGFSAEIKEIAYNKQIIRNVLDFIRGVDYSKHYVISTYNSYEQYMDYEMPQYNNMSGLGADDPYSRILFRVEYQPRSNISLLVSKNVLDERKFEKVVFDNQGGSMVNAEISGKNAYSKVERQGRALHTIQSRVVTLSQVQPIPSWYNNEICYKRDMLIYDNFINVAYFMQEKNLLLNYYNEVRSKERAWELAENYYQRQARDKYYIMLSQQAIPDNSIPLVANMTTLARSLLDTESYDRQLFGVEYALVNVGGVRYVVSELDKRQFGRSVVLSYSFYDNVIAGVNIKSNVYDGFATGGYIQNYIKYGNDSGYLQTLETYFMNDIYTFNADNGITYYPSLKDKQDIEFVGNYNPTTNWSIYSPIIQYSPQLYLPSNFISSIGSQVCYIKTQTQIEKDNREAISLTTQFEYCTDNDDIVIYNDMIKNSALLNSRENKDWFKEIDTTTIVVVPSGSTISQVATDTTVGHKFLAYFEDITLYRVIEVVYAAEPWTQGAPQDIHYLEVGNVLDMGDYVYYNKQRYIIGDEVLVLDTLHNGLPTGWKIIKTNDKLTRDTDYSKITAVVGTNDNFSFIATGFDNVLQLTFNVALSTYGNIAIVDNNNKLMLAINNFNYANQVYYFNLLKHPAKKVYATRSSVFADYKVSDNDYNEYE